jgi:hypothetical protein
MWALADLKDFGDDHRQWQSCDPFALFDAHIKTFISPVSYQTHQCDEADKAESETYREKPAE